MNVDWTTDDAGRMIGFSSHDARMVGLEWDQMSYLRIKLAPVSGEVNTVELRDLEMVTLNEVWNGAILLDVSAWPVTAVPETVWNVSDGAWHVLLSGRTHRSDERSVADRLIKRKPSAFLVHFSFSYGGDIAAICEKITVSTEETAR